MKIIADNEAHESIKQLCDIALKHGGLANHQAVAIILNSIKPFEQPEQPEVKKDGATNDDSKSSGNTAN